jgi:hypothetical protein
VGPNPVHKAEKGRNKQQVQSTKVKDVQAPALSQKAKNVQTNPRSRQRILQSTPGVPTQSKPQQQRVRQAKAGRQESARSQPQSIASNEKFNRRSRRVSHSPQSLCPYTQDFETERWLKSNRIESWASQVPKKASPNAPRPSTVNHFLRLNNLLGSAAPRNYEYDNSDEDMAPTSNATTDTKKGGKAFDSTCAKFVSGLAERNVEFDPVVDDDKEWLDLENIILAKPSEICTAQDERNWKVDLMKCKVSDEAILQRTIMMDLINRHHLEDTLDYTCESQWSSPSTIPQRDSALASRMPKPKPDLAIAFKGTSLLSRFRQADLQNYRGVMFPESSKQVKRDRAFHFLSIEVKGALGENENWSVHQQNFNTATQALHNMFIFMKLAGKEALEEFYKKVRFFSVVATSKAFHVRVHRAIRLDEAGGRIKHDYPLGFLYYVLYNHEGGTYTRATAAGIVQKILVEYAVPILQPLLKTAMEKAWENFRAQPEQCRLQAESDLQGVQAEAEAQRGRQRAESRHSRDASATARPSRKKGSPPVLDASFARKALDVLSVGTSSSSAFESRTS